MKCEKDSFGRFAILAWTNVATHGKNRLKSAKMLLLFFSLWVNSSIKLRTQVKFQIGMRVRLRKKGIQECESTSGRKAEKRKKIRG